MAKIPTAGNSSSRGQCASCDYLGSDEWRRTHPMLSRPLHCLGVAWQPARLPRPAHHGGTALYAPCWQCHGSLGCDQCSGVVTEVLCRRCAVWGTADALAAHGPVLNTPSQIARRRGLRAPMLEEYPASFQAAYRRAGASDPPELQQLLAVQQRVESPSFAVFLAHAAADRFARFGPDDHLGKSYERFAARISRRDGP